MKGLESHVEVRAKGEYLAKARRVSHLLRLREGSGSLRYWNEGAGGSS